MEDMRVVGKRRSYIYVKRCQGAVGGSVEEPGEERSITINQSINPCCGFVRWAVGEISIVCACACACVSERYLQ